jgi:hypothetical protein
VNPVITPPVAVPGKPAESAVAQPAASMGSNGMSTAVASQIKDFTGGWGKGKGSGAGTRSREFEFTAYIGQYNGGNWNSTVRVVQGNKIETGSLPNLLYLMSAWSKDKIKTNYQNVRAIKLDSVNPLRQTPFIFLTGTKDFKLSIRKWKTSRMRSDGRMYLGRQLIAGVMICDIFRRDEARDSDG